MGAGKWIVPWISRRARPEGVWRIWGSGFSVGSGVGGEGAMRIGIDGIVLHLCSRCI